MRAFGGWRVLDFGVRSNSIHYARLTSLSIYQEGLMSSKNGRIRFSVFCTLILPVLVVLAGAAIVHASGTPARQSLALERQEMRNLEIVSAPPVSLADAGVQPARGVDLLAPLVEPTTTLTVSIISSPWATVDHNNPPGPGPRAFVVQAVITNTSEFTPAEAVTVVLDYPNTGGWSLVPGETPTRTITRVLPGATYYVYWFARYPNTYPVGAVYTVTASASNAAPVSTSRNRYEGLTGEEALGDYTVMTRGTQEGDSTGFLQADADVVVGQAFTVTMQFNLSQNPERLIFSPAGNDDFAADAYRLTASDVTFYNSSNVVVGTREDRLYFPLGRVPIDAIKAVVNYHFISLQAKDTVLCPYTTVSVGHVHKYDKDFCTPSDSIPITGSLSISLIKAVNVEQYIQQGETLTYTLSFSVAGDSPPLGYVWVWDELPHGLGTVSAVSPSPTISSNDRVAWYLGTVPGGYARVFTITFDVDGRGAELPDQLKLVNRGLFGISRGSLPTEAAYTSTVTTTLQAPTIELTKTDGLVSIKPEEVLTYTIEVHNSGSITATDVAITDFLPAEVDYTGGQTVTWTLDAIPPGATEVRTIPVTVDTAAGNRTVLTNTVNVDYHNPADWPYTREATDTTVVYARGFIDGYAFVDTSLPPDGVPGQRDDDEVGVPGGVTVTLYGGTRGGMQTTTTDPASGYYTFEVEIPEPMMVVADLPDGYFRTTAGTVITDARLWITQTIDFGYAPITETFGAVYGTVYEDADHDGTRDLDEKGLPGAEIASPWAITSPVTSRSDGRYTLLYTISDTVTITETNPPLYLSTTPDVVSVDVMTGTSPADGVDFGDYKGIKITGQVFSDTNVNGQNDSGEAGIPGVYLEATLTSTVPASTTTDSTGTYTMYMAVNGGEAITVTERDEPGYVSTGAVPDANMVKVDANRLLIPSAASGTIYRGYYGDVWASDVVTITGQVWEDADVDGAYDVNAGLGGAVVSVQDGMTQTTDATGDFVLYASPSAAITVTEKNPTNYWSTNAIPGDYATKVDNDTLVISLPVAGSISEDNLFGDAPITGTTLITGVVFDDANENGVLGTGEAGLAGVTVTLKISDVTAPIVVQTDPAGRYQFAAATGSWVRITSSGPGDPYYATMPETSLYVLPAGTVPNVNFGYSDDVDGPAVIMGVVFDDANLNRTHDFGEPGLAGAVITLDGGASITTTGDGAFAGTYRFTTTVEGVHSLHEQNPPGYPRSTTPDDVRFEVVLAEDYWIVFGDTDRVDVTSFIGTVFDDLDVDGSWDLNEPGLAGITVTMASGLVGSPEAQVTNPWGQYGFTIDTVGTYTVTESDPDGYVSTNAIPGAPAVERADNNTLRTTVATVGADLGNNLFGDVLAGDAITISGTVWDDDGTGGGTAGDGVRNGGEPGLAGAVVSLDTGMTQTTALDGAFLLYGPPNAAITVTEKNPAGYVSTGAEALGLGADVVDDDTMTVSGLSAGESSIDNRFGDVLPAELTIDKGASSTAALAGAVLTYTLVYSNDGPSYAQDVYLVDALPDEVAFGGVVSQPGEWDGPPSYLAGPPETLTWYTSSLPSGASGTIIFTVTVDSGASGVLTNSASIYSNMPDNSPGGNEDQEVTGIDIAADLGIEKAGDPKTVVTGERLTYTLTVTNRGPSDATGVTVTDTLPVGVDYVSSSPGGVCSESLGVVTCDVDALGAGSDTELTVVVDVASWVTSALENEATVAGAEYDPVSENDSATLTTMITTVADLGIEKTGDPGTVAGERLTYTLVVTNHGPSDATMVVVTDTLPEGVSYVDGASSTECDGAGGTVTCDLDTLGAGLDTELTVVVDVASWVTSTLENEAEVAGWEYDPVTGNDTATLTTTVTTVADLEIEKTGDPGTVVAGETLTYTLVVTNHGPSDATGVVMMDMLPGEVEFVSIVGCQSGDVTSCTLSELPAGEDRSVEIVVTVRSWVTATFTNVAGVVGNEADPDAGNNVAGFQSQVETEADLAILKDGPSNVTAGKTLTYTLVVENNGPSDALNVVVTDTLPAGVEVKSTEPAAAQDEQDLEWDVGTLDSGDTVTLTVVVMVNSDVTGDITNTAGVSSATFDPATPNVATWTVYVGVAADLEISKMDKPDPVIAGETLTYTLVVVNHGTSDAVNVVVSDTLPAGVSLETTDPEVLTATDQTLEWNLGTLVDGESVPIVIVVTVDSDVTGIITNRAEVSSDTYDPPALDNNVIAVTTLVRAEADLEIGKADWPDPVVAGETLTYTLTITNNGPSDATGVSVTDVLPPGVVYDAAASSGACADVDGVVTCGVGALGASQMTSVEVVVTVDPARLGVLSNFAGVTAVQPDPNLANNTDTADTEVETRADLSISKIDEPDPVVAGTTLIYTVTVRNDGPSDALEVTVTDTLPVGVVVERTDPPVDREDGRVLEWDLERLADGTSETIIVVVVVDRDVAGAIDNVAEAASATFDPTEPNAVTESTWVGTEADLWVTKSDSPGPVSAGTPLTYYVSYGNDGPADAQNVCITDTLPDDVTYVDVLSQPGRWDGPDYAPGSPATLTWCRATLAAGESDTIVFAVMVNPDVVGAIANSVVIASDTSDPAMGNNAPPPTVSSTSCEADAYEEDDTSEAAAGLSTGVRQFHNFCDDDTDWLAVQTRAGYVYTVTTSSVGQRADAFLALLKSDGSTLLAANDDYEGTEDYSSQIAWKASVNGIYYVRVTNRAGLFSGYTEYEVWLEQKEGYFIYLPIMLQKSGTASVAEVEVLGVIEHTCADDYETDDTWQLAQPAELGVWQEHSFDSDPTWYAADKDFVWFEIKQRQTFVFTVVPVEGTETLLELWDEDGSALNVEGSDKLVWTALAGGRYYLSVSPLTPHTYGCAEAAGYDLLVEMAPRWEIYLPIVVRSSR